MSLDQQTKRSAPWLAHPQAIRAIIFDAGFTLIRPSPSTAAIIQRIGAAHGVEIDADALRAHIPTAAHHFAGNRHTLRGTWADNAAINAAWLAYFTELFAPFIPADQPDLLALCADEALAIFDHADGWEVFEDVRPTLDALRGRYTLGIISDWGISLATILRDHDLHEYFDFLVVSATSRRAKPDPAIFEIALQRADALGDYSVYVGDTYVQDILGARSAGINPVLIDRRARLDPGAIDCPVIHDLSELLGLLGINQGQASG